MVEEKYIQVGSMAARDPKTGEFLPTVPLYIKADEAAIAGEEKLIQNIGKVLAQQYKKYLDGCREVGVAV